MKLMTRPIAANQVLLLLSFLFLAAGISKGQDKQCRYPWTFYNNSKQCCTYGSTVNDRIKTPASSDNDHCHVNSSRRDPLEIMACYCMTYSEQLNKTTVVGNCLYSCADKYYQSVPMELQVNCDELNREGQLCGKCKQGHCPPVYSYSSQCVNCTSYKYNWLKYIAAAYIPLTVFYAVTITFRVSATSPTIKSYILISQIVATPAQLRYLYLYLSHTNQNFNHLGLKVAASLYAIWNLDFFRSLYPPFCLHPNMTLFHVLALDYIIGLYPLGLIMLTYALASLHDRFSIVARILRPIHSICKHFTRFRRQYDIRSSLIDAFVTFFLLSYVKIMNVSLDMLLCTQLYDIHGNKVNKNYLYYNATLELFHDDHIPFAVMAIIMITLFNILPLLLLLLYPSQCFQRCLNCCRINSLLLHMFMDSLNGCYKMKPTDCRYFAAFYLLLRILNLAMFSAYLNRFYLPFTAMLYLCATAIVAIVRPYKSSYSNNLEIFFLSGLTVAYISLSGFFLTSGKLYDNLFLSLVYLLLPIPLCYAFGVVIYTLVGQKVYIKLKTLCSRSTEFNEGLLGAIPPEIPQVTESTYTENSLLLASSRRVTN